MVSAIYISNKKQFVPQNNYSTLEQFCNTTEENVYEENIDENECVEWFDNMTAYFSDLGYFDPYVDIANKNSVEVRQNVKKSIDVLIREGVKPAVWKDGDKNDWWNGYKRMDKNEIGRPILLSNTDRKRGLLFHLNTLLETTYNYDETYVFYIL